MFQWRKLRKLRKVLYSRKKNPKILIVRNDGLGDVILTLPLVASLKKQVPNARITLLVHASLQGLLNILPQVEGVVADPGCLLRRHRAQKDSQTLEEQESQLTDILRAQEFDAVIMVYSELRSARLVHRLGIPFRIGTGRRFYSWRFNLKNPYSRKQSRMAESWHNLQMLKFMGLSPEFEFPQVQIKEAPAGTGIVLPSKPYIVVHPIKRSGTALTWPISRYKTLIKQLVSGGYRIVIIGDNGDRNILEKEFSLLLKSNFVLLRTEYNLRQLAVLLSSAAAFVGNSSGPLHMAGLMEIPHVGFFPQNRVSAPSRWKTLKKGEGPVIGKYLLSSKYPIQCIQCIGPKCHFYNCVDSIQVSHAISGLKAWGLQTKVAKKTQSPTAKPKGGHSAGSKPKAKTKTKPKTPSKTKAKPKAKSKGGHSAGSKPKAKSKPRAISKK